MRTTTLLIILIVIATACSNDSNSDQTTSTAGDQQATSTKQEGNNEETNLSEKLATEALLGSYSVRENGRLVEFIRIAKSGSQYTIASKEGGRWQPASVATPVTRGELEELVEQKVNVDFVGLADENIGVFKVPKGWGFGEFTCNTGYWLATMIGPIDLHKN